MGEWEGERLWEEHLGLVRNQVRQVLVGRQLAPHLPAAGPEVSVLDAGCGQGTQLLQLAGQGFSATGLDVSERLLVRAEGQVAAETEEVRARVRLVRGDLLKAGELLGERFDVVLCHGVLMYLPSLDAGLEALSAVLAPGGLLSVLTRNRAGIAMRAAFSGDWSGALEGFDRRHYANRVGVEQVRADDPEEVTGGLASLGLRVVTWYGVRLFTDHWGDVPPPDDFDPVLRVEEEAGRRDPYRRLAALTHAIARADA